MEIEWKEKDKRFYDNHANKITNDAIKSLSYYSDIITKLSPYMAGDYFTEKFVVEEDTPEAEYFLDMVHNGTVIYSGDDLFDTFRQRKVMFFKYEGKVYMRHEDRSSYRGSVYTYYR